MTTKDVIRRCRFTPYANGKGPSFGLIVWDTGRVDTRHLTGKSVLGYRLTQCTPCANKTFAVRTLFEGEDFACSPMCVIDSDECVASLMGFLTLRPGDTDAEYFANYTEAQLDFASQHAEALGMEVMNRFGEESR